jgi:RND family efflux transporter MFP subunit
MSARLIVRLALVAVVLAAAVFALVHFLRPVAVVTPVARGLAVNVVPATLTVLAETRELRGEIGGRIAETTLVVGKSVKEGELLVQLDTSAAKIELAQIESDIAAARERKRIGPTSVNDLAAARALLEYLEEELTKGLGTKSVVDTQKRLIEQVQMKIDLETVDLDQRLATLENNLKLKQDQLERMALRAPIDGVVARIFSGRGDLIGGGTPVAEIIAHDRTVEASISEEYFGGVAVGQRAQVRFLGLGEKKYFGKVAKILPASDPRTQRYLVHLEVEIEPGQLAPGITGDAMIYLDQHENAMIIPRPALLGKRVFVVANGTVEAREVEPGFDSISVVEIRSGLRDGEMVIVDLLDRFREGQRVRTERAETTAEKPAGK